jgi:hypothetical protein
MATKDGVKTGGRTKGIKNAKSALIETFMIHLINNNYKQLEEDILKLNPKDRLIVLLKMIGFIIPKPNYERANEQLINELNNPLLKHN